MRGQFAFRDDVPLVRLEVADEWLRPEQAVVRYRIETVFARSSWDWIGLYRVRRAGVGRDSGDKGAWRSSWASRVTKRLPGSGPRCEGSQP